MFSSSLSQYGYSYRFFNASFLFSLFSLPRNSCTAAGGRELWAASLNYRHKGVGVLAGKSQEQEPAVEGCSERHWAVTNWLSLTVPQHQVVSLAVFSTWKLLCCGIRSLSRHRCSHNPPAGKERSQVGLVWFGTVGSAKEGCWGLRAVKVQSHSLSSVFITSFVLCTIQKKHFKAKPGMQAWVCWDCVFWLILPRTALLPIKCCCCSYTAAYLQNCQCCSVFSASASMCCIGWSLMPIFSLHLFNSDWDPF